MLTDGRTDGRTHGRTDGRTDGRRTKSDHNSSSWAELRWAKKGQIKGMNNTRMLILSYTIQMVVPNVNTKFWNPRCSSSWEIFETNVPVHCTGVKDGKKGKKVKRSHKKFQHCDFLWQYTSIVCRCIQNLKTLALLGVEKYVMNIFYWIKRKTDK